ncbi:MAG: RnfABCDGE type electron transport complex subunit G [Dehalococcoidia bacterium]
MQVRDALKKAFPVILLTVVVGICVTILTGVGGITLPRIEALEKQKIQTMLSEMFPDMTEYDFEDEIYTIYREEQRLGYAFIAVGKGYGGDISILVGLEDEATIRGITVISHTETPGLGSKITEDFFTAQFLSTGVDDVALRRDGGQIDSITGATISARAVVEAVRITALEKIDLIRGNGEGE